MDEFGCLSMVGNDSHSDATAAAAESEAAPRAQVEFGWLALGPDE